jgi:hypothetical protein
VGITEDQVFGLLSPYFPMFLSCAREAYQHYVADYPDKDVHRPGTRASIVNDVLFKNVVNQFDEIPDCHPVDWRESHLRFLNVSDFTTSILLWFKKVDSGRMISNYPTQHSLKMMSGQVSFLPEATVIVAGYMLNRDETEVRGMTFQPPTRGFPEWYIDIEPASNVVPMSMGPVIVGEQSGIRIFRSIKQGTLGQ